MHCTLYQNTMYPFVVLHIQLTEFHETRKIWHGYHCGNILFGVFRWDTARAVHQVIVIRQKHFRLNLVESNFELKSSVLLKHVCSKDFEVPLYFESD